MLRKAGLVVDHRTGDDPEPFDITRVPLRSPAPRSAALGAMAWAETGTLVGLWYRSILGPDGDDRGRSGSPRQRPSRISTAPRRTAAVSMSATECASGTTNAR
ncbi:hypothetical protein [Mycobacterium tilburgii]|uniref:hypothetical protein n=1 Tax=Mycobacterium tilburgii TaxID=44467 RepID=UPI0028C429B8|nr:hypothetical protein [Mycobacterium tilburgii]